MAAQTGIRHKLIKSTMIIIIAIFATMLAVVSILNVSEENSKLRKTLRDIQESLEGRGLTLVINNSLAMRSMAADNAIVDVKGLVASTVSSGKDMAYGIYMDAERRPWAYASSAPADTAPSGNAPLQDSMSLWASSLAAPAFKARSEGPEAVLEFAGPVRIDGEIAGFIRYGISMKSISQAVLEAKALAGKHRAQSAAVLFTLALAAMVGGYWAARRQALRITGPIASLVASAQDIARGDYSSEVKAASDDEIRTLAEAFEFMRMKVRQYTDHLQDLVDEKMRQVKDILDNIEQGLFTLSLDGRINPEHSVQADAILEVADVSRCGLKEAFRISDEIEAAFRDWLEVVAERHKKSRWTKLAKLAPVQEIRIDKGGGAKHIKLGYRKILDKNGELVKIMVLAMDVTESQRIEALMEEERRRHENEVKVIIGLVNNPPETTGAFLADAQARLARAKRAAAALREEADAGRYALKIAELFRDLHTVKGGAGSYGFDLLSLAAHRAEDALEDLRKSPERPREELPAALEERMQAIEGALQHILRKQRILSGDQGEAILRVPESRVNQILDLCEKLRGGNSGDGSRSLIAACRMLPYKSLATLTRRYKDLVARLAEKLGKEAVFVWEPVSLEIHPEPLGSLDEAVTHLIRNCVDHGIESAEERGKLGKGKGCIRFTYREDGDNVHITIRDDGRGMDPDLIARKAVDRGLLRPEAVRELSPEAKLRLVFLPGFSTVEQVTSVSGRGTGMHAALKNVEALQGAIALESEPGKGTYFHIRVPRTRMHAGARPAGAGEPAVPGARLDGQDGKPETQADL
ncbi:MAG TPA: ATP-binding protein [Fibrobacteria bacterium]|nr:ATP-binding protein [Fibrobacteria bacterium]